MPEDESEQLQEEDDTLGSEIQEEDEGVAVKEKKLMFLSMVCCSLVEGAHFGNPPGLLQKKLMKICKSLAECEPEFILKVALYARQELNIRSTANFLLALASYLQPCRPHVRRYFCHVVQLPSDWMQVAKLYQSLAGEEGTLAPMPSCLRAGMADKFRQFDAYQLAKYNTRKSRGKQRHKPKAAKSERNTSWDNWKKHKLGRNPVFAARYKALQKTVPHRSALLFPKSIARALGPSPCWHSHAIAGASNMGSRTELPWEQGCCLGRTDWYVEELTAFIHFAGAHLTIGH
uniref:TROVE domain-containing protein n=1 Tax=Pseudonaja textilis TaxID=8673 RepID=A0A670ZI67_PSETE